jgi:VanZ family protein
MTTTLFRRLAWVLLAAIIILSLAPPSLRPETPVPHSFEHFAIFAMCGYAFGLGYRVGHLWQALALVAFSGVIELFQLLAPGRHARAIDFAVDSLACCAGMLLAWLTVRRSLAGTARER